MGKSYSNVSMAIIRRLPKYYEYLKQLIDKNIDRISSKELSRMIGFTPSQIRQDLNKFGGFGQQGYGYNVEVLYGEIEKILGLNQSYSIVVVGAGSLGQGIVNHIDFENCGFDLKALFDIKYKFMGKKIKGAPIFYIDELQKFISENHIDIGVICMPEEFVQDTANKLIESGVSAIWNFSPIDLDAPEGVIVENMNLNNGLLTLSYFVSNSGKDQVK
ncbi:CoA-binding domain protein [Alkaliphilus metalliredigens QYMF]|uniref:Redox-sensing transcriptional repressor Rex n=1 Tax=Alkaliphilus metalliredigens (strain QYMF) TaxID=293826 RepID=A6TND6_ALKMQ|nr:redox-sensing transcriptional repressor Rex [Alkaliphilus metalliredigens]ABR47704.1 CoA-binding domain protein [Alkaliphilus metalliredigens QYMF]